VLRELFDQLEQRNEEVKDLIGGVPGFVSYTAFRSGEGGLTVTVWKAFPHWERQFGELVKA
jgi:hypothetical protein